MKFRNRVVTVVAALAIAAIPTVAFAGNGNGNGNGNHGTTGATGAKSPRGHAYGFYCQGQSKKHVKGQKGTPFSQCVHAMKLLSTGKASNPAKACAGLSKKHVPHGAKGTPFSQCVSGGAKLLKDSQ